MDEWKIFHLVDSKHKTIANTIEKAPIWSFIIYLCGNDFLWYHSQKRAGDDTHENRLNVDGLVHLF